MTQNIYDDPAFFAGYSALPRSIGGLDAAPEWPSLRALLPPVRGLRVLDLGCGFGWFCRWTREAGASRVLGLDVSETMLARARATTADPAIAYARQDLEHPDLGGETFDLAYSSLAFHYIGALAGLLATVHAALTPGGQLVFSTEHPLTTAPRHPGWMVDQRGAQVWPVESYGAEGPRSTDWLAPGVVKQHRMLGTVLNLLIGAGYAITHVGEWGPDAAQRAAHPEWLAAPDHPVFLLVAARKTP